MAYTPPATPKKHSKNAVALRTAGFDTKPQVQDHKRQLISPPETPESSRYFKLPNNALLTPTKKLDLFKPLTAEALLEAFTPVKSNHEKTGIPAGNSHQHVSKVDSKQVEDPDSNDGLRSLPRCNSSLWSTQTVETFSVNKLSGHVLSSSSLSSLDEDPPSSPTPQRTSLRTHQRPREQNATRKCPDVTLPTTSALRGSKKLVISNNEGARAAFLIEKRACFLPLLPAENFITTLIKEKQKSGDLLDNTSIFELESIAQPRG